MGDTLRRGMEDAGYGGRFGMGGASVMQKYMNYNPSGQVQTQVRKKKQTQLKRSQSLIRIHECIFFDPLRYVKQAMQLYD